MEIGEIGSIRRRKTDIIAEHLPDPFYDSYDQEALACCAIIDCMGKYSADYVTITIDKQFLRKIVHSHLMIIKDIQKGLAPVANGHPTPR